MLAGSGLGRGAARALAGLAVLAPGPALAWRAVVVSDGTAGPVAQGTAAALALFPIVAVAVFALARWLGLRG